MQRNRTVQCASGLRFRVDVPAAGRVRGLGLCDVCAIEVDPSQIPGLVNEIEERQRVATEALRSARGRWESLREPDREVAHALENELGDATHRLDVLAALRAQLPAVGSDGVALLLGPQQTLSDLVSAAAHDAAEDLVHLLDAAGPVWGGGTAAQLERAARAALAFVQAHIECHAVTWFSLEANDTSDTADAPSPG